ncbi:MAG TPA: hypothetical protein VK976_01260 [Verrucomicrobiae bacterium]|jgi:archaellum biogenesis protein FlaJ (TadC family)|nr:hypothetical protein [Verrucomicrobiae bacterium]
MVKSASIVKVTLLFSACFVSILLAGTFALIRGVLSPRGFGVAISVLCIVAVVILSVVWSRIARKAEAETTLNSSDTIDESTRKRRMRAVRFYQGWIALLVVCFLYGLTKAGTAPVAPLAVGLVMNALWIFASIQAIKKLRNSVQ